MTEEIRQGDALERLRELESGSVQCCITSPPFYGLRDYNTGQWEGGDPECDHRPETRHQAQGATSLRAGRSNVEAQRNETFRTRVVGNAPSRKSTLTTNNGAGPRPGDKYHADQRQEVMVACPCGAHRIDSQIGLEQTPAEYVARLVEVFAEVRRVLRDDGVLWLNLGDSYNNRSVARPSSHQGGLGFTNESIERSWADGTKLGLTRLSLAQDGLKEKDLLGIPWMVAFALRADGWYLRSDVIWAKPNPMPESVTDRPTSAHEHLFLLTKSARYYYDAEAIREQAKDWSKGGPGTGILTTEHYGAGNGGNAGLSALAARYKHQGATWQERREAGATRGNLAFGDNVGAGTQRGVHGEGVSHDLGSGFGRNKRNVWEIATQPYPEAHFATFPVKLVEPCVQAGSSPKACGQCGAPWRRRLTERGESPTFAPLAITETTALDGVASAHRHRNMGGRYQKWLDENPRATTGWEPTCDHVDDSGRCLVLDPFAGSGTVGVVCEWFGRDFLGIDLNPDYCEMARRRILRRDRPFQMQEVNPGQLAFEL